MVPSQNPTDFSLPYSVQNQQQLQYPWLTKRLVTCYFSFSHNIISTILYTVSFMFIS